MFKNLRRSLLGFAVVAASVAVVPVASSVATAADGTIDSTNWAPLTGGLGKFAKAFSEGGTTLEFSSAGGHVDSSGRLLIIGNVGTYGAQTPALVRMTTAGVLDTSFDGNGLKVLSNWNSTTSTYINEVRTSGSSIYLLGGAGNGYFMGDKPVILKIDESGSVDTSWGSSGWVVASEAAQMVSTMGSFYIGVSDIYILGYRQNSGEAVVHKFSTSTGLPTNMGITSQNYMTIPTSTWSNSGFWHAGIFPASGGKVVIYTTAMASSQGVTSKLYRFDVSMSSAQLDTSYGTSGVLQLAIPVYFIFPPQQNNSGILLVAAERDDTNGHWVKMAQLHGDGTLDTTWGSSGYTTIPSFEAWGMGKIAKLSDGSFVLKGSIPPLQGNYGSRGSLLKFTSSGAIDTSFDSDGIVTPDSRCDLFGAFVPISSGNFYQLGIGTDYVYNPNFQQVDVVRVLKWATGGLAASSCTGQPPTPGITPSSATISGTVNVAITPNSAPVLSNYLSTPTFALSQYSAALPAGLTFNAQTGVISGTPTATSSAYVSFDVSNGAQSASYSVNFNITSGSGGGSGGGIPSVIPLPASTWGADCSSATNKSFTGFTTTPSNSFDFLLGGCMGTGTNVYIGIQSAGVGVQTNVSGTWGSTNPPTIRSTMPTKNDLTSYQRTGSISGIKLLFNATGPHTVYVANDACYNSLPASTTPISACSASDVTTFSFSISVAGGGGGGGSGPGSCTAGAETIVGTSPGVDTTFGGGWQEIAPASATEGSYGGIVKTSDNALLVVNGVSAPSGGTLQLRKFDLNGSPVAGFGQSGVLDVDVSSGAESSVTVRGVSVGPDGDVTVNGIYLVGSSVSQNHFVLKLTSTGAVDTSFDPAGVAGVVDFQSNTSVMRTATLKNGSVLIVKSNPNGIIKYDATGAVVAGFAGSGTLSLLSSTVVIAPTSDGGFFTQTAMGDVVISRYDGSGVLTSWAGAGTKTLGDPNASDATGGMKLTSSGLLVAYGTSTSSGGTPAYTWKVTKLDTTTGAEATFGTGGTVATTWSKGRATGIEELSDGSIAVSGVLFDTFGPTAAMIKLTAAGEIASAFSSGPAAFLHGSCSLSLSTGGTIAYGGIVPVADGKFVALMSKFVMSAMPVKATLVRLDFGLSGSGNGSGGGSGGSSTPTLVNSSNQSLLERDPGSEGMIINGQSVTIETTRVEITAARTPASQRTPAQVAAIQAAGQALLQEFLASLPAGAVTNVAVVNTTTGAVMRNLVFDANGNSLDVPVEDIVILDGPSISLMIGSNNANITSDGKYQVGAGGVIGVVGSGLGASAPGELVVMSTPTLIGNFTTSATGDVSKSAQLPGSIGVGDHTLVVATGTTYVVMGLRVVPSALPSTGLTDGTGRTVVIALFTMVFAAVLVRSRRLALLPR